MSDGLNTIRAPWTLDEIAALWRFQQSPIHPFTCALRNLSYHTAKLGDAGLLVPMKHGWVCPDCDYVQNWAHKFMLDPVDWPPESEEDE